MTGEDAFRVLEALKICDTAGHLMMRHLTDPVLIKTAAAKSLSARLLYGSGIHERSVQVLSSGTRLRLTGAGRAAFKILHDFH